MILLGLAVSLGLTSCVKEADYQPASYPLDNSKAIVAKITQFHNEVTGNMKNDRPLSVDSVVWYTEADINYYYCIAYEDFNYSALDSFLFEVETDDNSMVEAAEYNNLYDGMIDSLTNFWNSIDEDDMYMVVVDVSVKSVQDGVALLKVSGFIGYGSGLFPVSSFGDDDYWYYGYGEGKCGPFSCCQGLDAAILIERQIRWQTPLQPYIWFFPVIGVYDFEGGSYDATGPNNPTDNYYDSKMYYCTYYGSQLPPDYIQCDFCLDPYEMNFHRSGTNYVYNDKNPNPTIYDNISIHVEGRIYLNQPDFPVMHVADFRYGIPHSTLPRTMLEF